MPTRSAAFLMVNVTTTVGDSLGGGWFDFSWFGGYPH
jgi:hypothetical protein